MLKRGIIISCALFLVVPACVSSIHTALDPASSASRNHLSPDWTRGLYDLPPLSYQPADHAVVTSHEGMLFLGGADGVVRRVDPEKGNVLWEFATRERVQAPPVVYNNSVFVGSFDGRIYSLNLENGAMEWSYDTGGPVVSSVAIWEGRAYVVNDRNSTFALDEKTGKYLWSKKRAHRTEFTIYGQAGLFVHKGVLYVGYSDGHLVAMEPEDGTTIWSKGLGGEAEHFVDVDSTPILRGGVLYVASFRGGMYAIGPVEGQVRWHHEVEGATEPVFEGDRLFVSTAGREVRCLSAADGSVIWRTRFDNGDLSRPEVAGPYILISTGKSLALLRASTGHVVGLFSVKDGFNAAPRVVDNRVYVLSNQGTLYAINWYTDGLE